MTRLQPATTISSGRPNCRRPSPWPAEPHHDSLTSWGWQKAAGGGGGAGPVGRKHVRAAAWLEVSWAGGFFPHQDTGGSSGLFSLGGPSFVSKPMGRENQREGRAVRSFLPAAARTAPRLQGDTRQLRAPAESQRRVKSKRTGVRGGKTPNSKVQRLTSPGHPPCLSLSLGVPTARFKSWRVMVIKCKAREGLCHRTARQQRQGAAHLPSAHLLHQGLQAAAVLPDAALHPVDYLCVHFAVAGQADIVFEEHLQLQGRRWRCPA